MTTRFLILAAIMVIAALACVLVPMLRSARRAGRPRLPFVIALVLALATPPAVFGMYLAVGTPAALQPPPPPTAATLEAATAQLAASVAKRPDNAQGWALLAQAYSALGQPAKALDALNHLVKLQPNDPGVLVTWTEARAEADPSHRIDDAGRARLQQALQIDPNQQRALWLLGISDFQRQDYASAAQHWRTLLPLLPKGSKVAATVAEELAAAEQHAGGALAAASSVAAADAGRSTAATPEVALRINVNISTQLLDRLKPDATLFVFARAVGGPPMPVAVARLDGVRFPASVTLTDAQAMDPARRLSQFKNVQVVARLSASGNASPHTGDLQSTPIEVATDTRAPVAVTLDRVD